MVELTLELLVDIAGEYSDGLVSSERFRAILQDEQTTSAEVEQFLHEALNGSKPYHNRALQDIVNNLGQRLGFAIEYGSYQGTTTNIGNDGLWISNAGEGGEDINLVVETKKSTLCGVMARTAANTSVEILEASNARRRTSAIEQTG